MRSECVQGAPTFKTIVPMGFSNEVVSVSKAFVENDSWSDKGNEAGKKSVGHYVTVEAISMAHESETHDQTKNRLRVSCRSDPAERTS